MLFNKHISRLAPRTVQFGINYEIANQQGKISIEDMKEILTYSNKKVQIL